MSRRTDRERVLTLLGNGRLSCRSIREQLGLRDDRFHEVRAELVNDGFVEAYRCRGGGLAITDSGRDAAPVDEHVNSAFASETAMYDPFVSYLTSEGGDDDVNHLVVDVSSLRQRGTWRNPDVIELYVEEFPTLRRRRLTLTSYELKQWGADAAVGAFEAASHDRFCHESWLVLERPEGITDERYDTTMLDRATVECQRFGVGLMTVTAHGDAHELHDAVHLSPRALDPPLSNLEEYLGELLRRRPELGGRFEQLMRYQGDYQW